MNIESSEKVTAGHLMRKAYVYIRQSSIKQVIKNVESGKRQYGLRERALALGWPQEQIVVIDKDQGESASPEAADREGFEKLVTDVSMGRAGIVVGLEVSRLARSNSAWHRLLDICAVTDTLVLDLDGLYDTRRINDRLLLGLKGAISEAEWHTIRQRMHGGALNKAERGELRVRLPVGFIYDEQNRVVRDPDKQVRQAIDVFFKTFHRVGSAYKTAKFFGEQGLKFPKRIYCGPTKGQTIWGNLTTGRVSLALHSPRYAGAYAYGRSTKTTGTDRPRICRDQPREKWHTLILDAHEGYITWEDYQRNLKCLERNDQSRVGKRMCPPREGPALLQGLAVCGLCGRHMTVRYLMRHGGVYPNYICMGEGKKVGLPKCQNISGDKIDEAISELLLDLVTPVALEVSLAVQEEVQKRFEEADKLRLRQVERVRYEIDLAKRRYMRVDPDNRLVAEELEAEWNRKLRELRAAEEEYKEQRGRDHVLIDEEKRRQILSLAQDFPRLWRDPNTPQRERKRMAQLLIEDVTLIKNSAVSVDVRFKSGSTRSLKVPRALASYETWKTSAEVIAEIDRLLDNHTSGEIGAILNERGFSSGQSKTFNARRINIIQRAYHLRDRYTRLRERGLLTGEELAVKLGTTPRMVVVRRSQGRLNVVMSKLSDKGDYMYENIETANGENTRPVSEVTKGGVV
ncbi:MAG: recombinase family protein [Candidatus Krumholzibacteriia bacterium]